MIKYNIVIIILFISTLGCSSNNIVEVDEQEKEIKCNRHPSQIYLDDSTDVFWTYYPDPFNNPTYLDRFVVTQAITFKCFLNGKLEVGFLDTKTDSIIYRFSQPSKEGKKLNEHFWIWLAKSSADTSEFPKEYFQSFTLNPLNIVLIVDDKKKSILPLNIVVPIHMYCFINWSNFFN
ncbi:MAG: hypothetical protein KKF62_07205 [Bacteroidetes bacterium]|nr:hypothetical protein [Bacteroidota bacterium]MBU1114131.1 hypothetical protein [Bacteroidota bacterium]MBU1796797.1 hypothetical protein [Bacteroidota bacterium]